MSFLDVLICGIVTERDKVSGKIVFRKSKTEKRNCVEVHGEFESEDGRSVGHLGIVVCNGEARKEIFCEGLP